jgi:release factor glutamine methyltransferase
VRTAAAPGAAHATAGGCDSHVRLLDVGTGTGAIALAVLNKLPGATAVGIDPSAAAVALASDNARSLQLDARFQAVRVAGGIAEYGGDGGDAAGPSAAQLFDVIVSNPPYIPAADMASLEPEVRLHEDANALCGGDDGLDVVRELLRVAPRLLDPDGQRTVWLEVDPSHPPLIEAWLSEAPIGAAADDDDDADGPSDAPGRAPGGLALARWMPDASGLPRFCEIRWRRPGDET